MNFFNKKLSLLKKTTLAVVDQGLLSAVNFFVSVVLIKNTAKTEYGYYALALAALMLFISVQNAVVTTPLTVLLPSKKPTEKKEYISSLLSGQYALLLPLSFIFLLVVVAGRFFAVDAIKTSIALAFIVAVLGMLLREFLRACLFAVYRAERVLVVDTVYVSVYISAIGLLWMTRSVSVTVILILMGVSAFVASLMSPGFIEWRIRWPSVKKSYSENWPFGRWALAGVIVSHVQNYAYLYLLGALLGSTAVADVSASRLLLMPLVLAQVGWGKVALPLGARLHGEKRAADFLKIQMAAAVAFVIVIQLYVFLVNRFASLLGSLVLTDKYLDALEFATLWGAIFSVGFVALCASFGLQAMKQFKAITQMSAITMALTVLSTFMFIRGFAVRGGLYALLTGESSLAILLWYKFIVNVYPAPEGRIRLLINRLTKKVANENA
jgi:O-antigen/teichoic acid export membrane protein